MYKQNSILRQHEPWNIWRMWHTAYSTPEIWISTTALGSIGGDVCICKMFVYSSHHHHIIISSSSAATTTTLESKHCEQHALDEFIHIRWYLHRYTHMKAFSNILKPITLLCRHVARPYMCAVQSCLEKIMCFRINCIFSRWYRWKQVQWFEQGSAAPNYGPDAPTQFSVVDCSVLVLHSLMTMNMSINMLTLVTKQKPVMTMTLASISFGKCTSN